MEEAPDEAAASSRLGAESSSLPPSKPAPPPQRGAGAPTPPPRRLRAAPAQRAGPARRPAPRFTLVRVFARSSGLRGRARRVALTQSENRMAGDGHDRDHRLPEHDPLELRADLRAAGGRGLLHASPALPADRAFLRDVPRRHLDRPERQGGDLAVPGALHQPREPGRHRQHRRRRGGADARRAGGDLLDVDGGAASAWPPPTRSRRWPSSTRCTRSRAAAPASTAAARPSTSPGGSGCRGSGRCSRSS